MSHEDTERYKLVSDYVSSVKLDGVNLSTEPGGCCSFKLVVDDGHKFMKRQVSLSMFTRWINKNQRRNLNKFIKESVEAWRTGE